MKRKAKQARPLTAIEIAEEQRRQLRAKTEAIRRAKCESYGKAYEAPAKRKLEVVRAQSNIVLEPENIDNPNWNRYKDDSDEDINPRKVTAMRNIRESSIEYLFSRKMIDESQRLAGSKFRMYWEAAGGKGAGAIDYSRPKVDGGGITDPVPVGRLEAGDQLKHCRVALGHRGFAIMERVAGEGCLISALSNSRSERDAFMYILKDGLTTLAEMWKFSQPRQRNGGVLG